MSQEKAPRTADGADNSIQVELTVEEAAPPADVLATICRPTESREAQSATNELDKPAPSRGKKRVFAKPLLLTALALTVVLSAVNFVIGAPYRHPTDYIEFSTMAPQDRTRIELTLQARLAREFFLQDRASLHAVLVDLGNYSLATEDGERAVRYFSPAFEIELQDQSDITPAQPVAYHILPRLLFDLHRYEEAARCLDRYRAAHPNEYFEDATERFELEERIFRKVGRQADAEMASSNAFKSRLTFAQRMIVARGSLPPPEASVETQLRESAECHLLSDVYQHTSAALQEGKYPLVHRYLSFIESSVEPQDVRLYKGMMGYESEFVMRARMIRPVVYFLQRDDAQAEKAMPQALDALAQFEKLEPFGAYCDNEKFLLCHHYARYLRSKGKDAEAAKFEAKVQKVRDRPAASVWWKLKQQ